MEWWLRFSYSDSNPCSASITLRCFSLIECKGQWALNEGGIKEKEGWWKLPDHGPFVPSNIAVQLVNQHHETTHLGKTVLVETFWAATISFLSSQTRVPRPVLDVWLVCKTTPAKDQDPTRGCRQLRHCLWRSRSGLYWSQALQGLSVFTCGSLHLLGMG